MSESSQVVLSVDGRPPGARLIGASLIPFGAGAQPCAMPPNPFLLCFFLSGG